MSSDFVEQLRDDFSAELKDSDPHTVINAYEEERHQAAERIKLLEAALDDLSGYVSRADWHYLKTDTVALLWGKQID